MLKKITTLIMTTVALLVPSAMADTDITVRVNNDKLEFDQPPIILKERTLVPLRGIFEKLGAEVIWDGENRRVNVSRKDVNVSVVIDSSEMMVNDTLVKLDITPIIRNDRTLIPLRAVSEALGAFVEWNDEFKEVNITSIEDDVTINPADASVKAINHRGYNTIAPENTLSAYRLSKTKGFTYVETDVRFTLDGVPVLLHDDTINRTARNNDGSKINKTIKIAEIDLKTARTYDFGIFKDEKYRGECIPTFEEFIQLCVDLELYPYIELKNDITADEYKKITDIIERNNMSDRVSMLGSPSTIERVAELKPEYRYGIVTGWIENGSYTTALRLKEKEVDVFINPSTGHYYNVSKNSCLQHGIPVEMWTIDDIDDIKFMIGEGITGITTNYANIADVLKELEAE